MFDDLIGEAITEIRLDGIKALFRGSPVKSIYYMRIAAWTLLFIGLVSCGLLFTPEFKDWREWLVYTALGCGVLFLGSLAGLTVLVRGHSARDVV